MTETLAALRTTLRTQTNAPEAPTLIAVLSTLNLTPERREAISLRAQHWVEALRSSAEPTLIESFLAEYGLSTDEGVALMCLAEAYLRVPDTITMDALIRDKVGTGRWSEHSRKSRSSLVNASTWALMLTGKVLGHSGNNDEWVRSRVSGLVRTLGEPMVRTATGQAMKVLGMQFVCGRTIDEAIENGQDWREKGYRYSYDMLGEAAKTAEEARLYFLAYSNAINSIAPHAQAGNVHANPGISIKLSALHPRYEYAQRDRVMQELVPRLLALAMLARNANIALNIDAEEAERLDISLDVMEAVVRNPDLAGWNGFGIVVQAYAKHALPTLQWVVALGQELKRRFAVRLVKGAYWDSEIKHAQQLGLEAYPVWTRKTSTDAAYMACAQYMLNHTDAIYPQFATHNAHTMAAVLNLAGGYSDFEFQRLHGMGESLHEIVRQETDQPSRIYAPVGVHKDLLAYLVRRLLENGANSSFVNQVLNEAVPAAQLVSDPLTLTEYYASVEQLPNPNIPLSAQLFMDRQNSRGWNVQYASHAAELEEAVKPYHHKQWQAHSLIPEFHPSAHWQTLTNPAHHFDVIGKVNWADASLAATALQTAQSAVAAWSTTDVEARALCLERAAALMEIHHAELMALLMREAGKNLLDAILELREAVDFCRFYAAQAREHLEDANAYGVVVCISPWNFPLAIFTGQIAAALVAGNSVVAKPAEQTNLIAYRAVELFHEAGVPEAALTLVLGDGKVGAALVGHASVSGVCFTGSTSTAIHIDRGLAQHAPHAFLIAETGGLNAMLIDSTALPQQAVRDMVASAFQSAGQRCSALRIALIQEDIAATILDMLQGTLAEWVMGNPWNEHTDSGPVIDAEAQANIEAYCQDWISKGRLIYRAELPDGLSKQGYYVPPTVLKLDTFEELEREVFGPVLHILTYKAGQVDELVDKINASGYHLTLGMHSRIGERVDRVCGRSEVGNIYINRNQIGAVVGVQPFGGDALSGTGPKAGGSHYLKRFVRTDATALLELNSPVVATNAPVTWASFHEPAHEAQKRWTLEVGRFGRLQQACKALPAEHHSMLQQAITEMEIIYAETGELLGPTGERNTYNVYGRGVVLCLGDGVPHALTLLLQVLKALAAGNAVLIPLSLQTEVLVNWQKALKQQDMPSALMGYVELDLNQPVLTDMQLQAVVVEPSAPFWVTWRHALAALEGARVPLLSAFDPAERFVTERVVSVDTTATGGNTKLLALAG